MSVSIVDAAPAGAHRHPYGVITTICAQPYREPEISKAFHRHIAALQVPCIACPLLEDVERRARDPVHTCSNQREKNRPEVSQQEDRSRSNFALASSIVQVDILLSALHSDCATAFYVSGAESLRAYWMENTVRQSMLGSAASGKNCRYRLHQAPKCVAFHPLIRTSINPSTHNIAGMFDANTKAKGYEHHA